MCKEHQYPLYPEFEFWRMWMFLTGVFYLDLDLDIITGLWYTHVPNFASLSWFWRCKEHPCTLSPHLGLCRTLEFPDGGLESWSWFRYGHWSLIQPWSKFCLSIRILKVQRTSMYFNSSCGVLEDAGCSWLRFDILILIWIWSDIFYTPMFQILALYLHLEGAKIIDVL